MASSFKQNQDTVKKNFLKVQFRQRLQVSSYENDKGYFFFFGLACLIWYLFRTGRKPSRVSYPCQQFSALNANIWLLLYIYPIIEVVSIRRVFGDKRNLIFFIVLVAFILSFSYFYSTNRMNTIGDEIIEDNDLIFEGKIATKYPASDIFVVTNIKDVDEQLSYLMDLMREHDCPLYNSGIQNSADNGLVSSDDIVLIKVNCQWDQRGGTNTDLLKNIIEILLDHPQGFKGEIVVVDNGQAQYGSKGYGGSFEWEQNNALDKSQSIQRVVNSFNDERVSTYLWDTITESRVEEYSLGDNRDGYVVNTTVNPRTGIMVSYPKFTTNKGSKISFKFGIWNPETENYDNDKLKVINVPVLKSHSGYDVTGAMKHYMGVPSDKLTRRLGARTHNTIRNGGMGTLMVETRVPILNIMDAIWVNANPRDGPMTPYEKATNVKVIAASTDPVALDYWASKNILQQTYEINTNRTTSTFDPESTESGSFGSWLRLSMDELNLKGINATMDEEKMNIFVKSSTK